MENVAWLGDGRRILFIQNDKLQLLDTRSGARKTLLDDEGAIGLGLTVSNDGRSIYTAALEWRSDIWMATTE